MPVIRVVGDLAIHAGEACPDKAAAFMRDDSITYADVLERSLRLGDFLSRTGVAKGDRVCLFLEKRFEKVIAIFGTALAGAVVVPIRRLSRPAQVLHVLGDSGAKVLITTAAGVASLGNLPDGATGLETVVSIGKVPDAGLPARLRLVEWDDVMRNAACPGPRARVTDRDLAAILYTSGSTGKPKGVVLSHLNVIAGTQKVSEYLGINPDDRLLSILSFGFDYGLNQLTTAFFNRAQIVLLDHLFPQDILNAVAKHRVTGLAAVAATWIQLVQASWESTAMPRLRYVTNSGGAIPPRIVQEIRRRLPRTKMFLMYGLTEAFRSTYLDPDLVDQYPGSIGKAIPGEEVMVLDASGEPVGPNEVGELVHRGVLVAQGYWNDPELTGRRFRDNPRQPGEVPLREKVVYSGDRVRVDEQGYLYFVGRDDDMIKCAGNRISPTEVEDVLYRCHGVAEAVAFGIPHETYGQTVYAVIALTGEGTVAIADVLKHCREQLPPYMVPSGIEVRQSLARNDNGKIDRSGIQREVRSRAATVGAR